MARNTCIVLALLQGWTFASPLLSWHTQDNATPFARDMSSNQEGVPVKRMAAIGDSYSAGIGAGNRLGTPLTQVLNNDWWCSRYDNAFPQLLHQDARLGDPGKRTFQFLSCSGALIKDVAQQQIPQVDANQDVILLSAGGNDLELVKILNQCIFQFSALSNAQVLVAKLAASTDVRFEFARDWDFDALGRGCEKQIAHSESLLDGPQFVDSVLSLILSAKQKLAPGGAVYYTGYAKFFADSMTAECDKVTWASWARYSLNSNWLEKQYLTVPHRMLMNKLVDKANAKIKEATSRAGAQVKFVDYDSYVGQMGGRYCEAGVDEASKESNSRPGLMFYEMADWDLLGDTIYKRGEADGAPKGTFKAEFDTLAKLTQLLDDQATLNTDKFAPASANLRIVSEESQLTVGSGRQDIVGKFLPDGYGRVFHPTKLLHRAIAQFLISEIVGQPQSDSAATVPFPDGPDPDALAMVSAGAACLLSPLDVPAPPDGDGAGKGGPGGQTPILGSGGPTIGKEGLDNFIGSGTPKSISKETGQQVALASYINPTTDAELWNRMIRYPADKVSVLVANVLNGPDSKVNDAWSTVINAAHGQGKTVIGYVRTGYLGVSKQQFKTMLGSTDLADWIAQIEADVETWYRLYPGKIMGIFFDEGWNECGPNNMYAKIYRLISDNTKRKHTGAYTVLNPGWFMPQCFEESADTLMTFESSYTRYLDRTGETYKENGWIPKDHRKIWHIVYATPQDKIRDVVALAKERHAGLLHITDALMPNPYNTLPSEDYVKTLMDAVEKGGPLIAPPLPPPVTGSPPALVSNLRVTDSDYTSAKLAWDVIGDAEAVAIYRFGVEVARLPGSMRRVTIGGLPIDFKKHEFKMRAIGKDGSEFAVSNVVTADTKALPGGKPIINAKVTTTATETIFEADVLVPYAFVRIMATDPDSDGKFAYALNTDRKAVYAKYMIEGCTSYKYNGKAPSPQYWPWDWATTSSLDDEGCNMKVDRDVYHYTWHFPIGTSTFDTTNFIVMGEGVSPRTDVFMPCPCTWKTPDGLIGKEKGKDLKYCDGKPKFCAYDCKGHTLCSSSSVKWCDKAVNQMPRGNHMYRSNGLVSESGNCWANTAGYGCSVLIRGKDENGKNCEISGDDLWFAYQDVHSPARGDCEQCGSKRLSKQPGNECMVSINYYEGCGNTDKGVINRLVGGSAEFGTGQTLNDGVIYGSMTGGFLR